MPLVVKDRVRETTTTLGTGTITLAGAVAGFQSFSAIGNANTTYYTINLPGANEWEVGIGTYTASGTTLSRDTILASSNSGSAVNFSAGTKDVFCTYPAGKSAYLDAANNLLIGTTTNTNTSNIVANGTISETVSGTQYLVASQFDVGTNPNQIPLNQYLGDMAFQSSAGVSIGILSVSGNATFSNGNLLVGTTSDISGNGAYGVFGNSSAAGANRWAAYFGANSASSNPAPNFGLAIGWNKSGGGGESNIVYGISLGGAPGLAFSSSDGTTVTERARITDVGGVVTKPAANGHTVFNEDGVDADFRVESDLNTHMLFVDAGNNKVVIGGSTPETNSTLTVYQFGTTGSPGSNNAQIMVDANANSGSGQAALKLLAGSGTTNRAARIDFLNGVNSTTTPRWTLLNDYNQDGTNDFNIISGTADQRAVFYSGSTVFNETSNDVDFRVESDTNTHALFVDAGNSWVGINNSSPVAPLSITSATDGSPTLTTSYTRLYTFTGSVLENNNYQIFKVTINDIRVNALLRISLQSENTAGIGRVVGSVMEVSVSRVDGGALVYVKNVSDGNISISEPVTSGNDVIFGAFNSNNGTGISINYACSVELVSGNPGSFVFTDIAPGTAHTGDSWIEQTRIYRASVPELLLLTGETVFNQNGNDQDFRVESDSNTHMLFVDGFNDAVGIGMIPLTTFGNRNSLEIGGNTVANVSLQAAIGETLYNFYIDGVGASKYATDGPASFISFNNAVSSGWSFQTYPSGLAGASAPASTDLLALSPNGTIFNEGGADIDFRVESDTNTHALFVDAGNNQVFIGAASGNSSGTPLNVVRFGTAGTITKILSLYDSNFFPSGYPTLEFVGWQGGGNTNRSLISYEPGSRLVFYTAPSSAGDPTPLERAAFGNTETVFNEISADVDFRVESDSNTHALFLDAGNSRIGINWSVPSATLTIGALSVAGTSVTNISNVSGIQINGNQANVSRTGVTYQDGGGGGAAILFGRGGSYNTDISFYTNSALNTSAGGMSERGYMGENGDFVWYSSAVFNENGGDSDFRVESDANTHMFFVDAGANAVLINQTSNTNGGALSVNGTFSVCDSATGLQLSMSKIGTKQTASISTVATTIFTDVTQGMSSASAGQLLIFGDDNSGNGFMDVVAARSSGTVAVVSSSTLRGSPAARTYTMSTAALQLAMASGTYSTMVRCETLGFPF